MLFICSRNQWRSPTAESIFKNRPKIQVRSAGTADSAKNKVSEKLLLWADMIFVMEKKHKEILIERFDRKHSDRMIVLGIPDDYKYMDPELVEMIKAGVAPYLE